MSVRKQLRIEKSYNNDVHRIANVWLFFVFSSLKYLWTPYVCMLAAFGVCSPELWMTLFKWLRLRTVHPVLLVSHCFVISSCFSFKYMNGSRVEYNWNSVSRSYYVWFIGREKDSVEKFFLYFLIIKTVCFNAKSLKNRR